MLDIVSLISSLGFEMTTTHTIDLQFQPLHTAEEILATLYTQTSEALETHNWVDAFCNMFIELAPDFIVFAEVKIDTASNDVHYYVTSSLCTSKRIPALTYTEAKKELRWLLS